MCYNTQSNVSGWEDAASWDGCEMHFNVWPHAVAYGEKNHSPVSLNSLLWSHQALAVAVFSDRPSWFSPWCVLLWRPCHLDFQNTVHFCKKQNALFFLDLKACNSKLDFMFTKYNFIHSSMTFHIEWIQVFLVLDSMERFEFSSFEKSRLKIQILSSQVLPMGQPTKWISVIN